MPVQAPQIALLPVEEEAVSPELHRAETKERLPGVQHAALRVQQLRPAGIAPGILRAPGLHPRNTQADARMTLGLGQAARPVPYAEAHGEGRIRQLQPRLQGIQRRREDEEIPNVLSAADVQPGLPIEAAIGQIVNDKAKGRHAAVFRAVQLHGHSVLAFRAQEIGDLHPEGGVAAAVPGALGAVHVDRCDVGGAVKLQEDPLPRALRGELQLPAIAADHLIVAGAGIVQGDLPHIVGQANRDGAALSAQKVLRPLLGKFPAVAKRNHSVSSVYFLSFTFYFTIENALVQALFLESRSAQEKSMRKTACSQAVDKVCNERPDTVILRNEVTKNLIF